MGFEIACRACGEAAYVTTPSEAETFMVSHASHAASVEDSNDG